MSFATQHNERAIFTAYHDGSSTQSTLRPLISWFGDLVSRLTRWNANEPDGVPLLAKWQIARGLLFYY